MITMAVDTSSLRGSIALFNERTLLAAKDWSRMNSHGELLTPSVQELLKQNKLTTKDIGLIAVGVGPGSFTGIRVGVNFARSVAYSLELPVFQMNSLQLLASQVTDSQDLPIASVQFGFRNLLYVSFYKQDKGRVLEIEPPHALTIEGFIQKLSFPHLILGTGFEQIKGLIPDSQIKNFVRISKYHDEPLASFFANTSALDQKPNPVFDWSRVIPLYIRASEAEEKLKSGALSPS
jgi:tRNA threonylcarbamoyladenosine biosynthesis protein TsaB